MTSKCPSERDPVRQEILAPARHDLAIQTSEAHTLASRPCKTQEGARNADSLGCMLICVRVEEEVRTLPRVHLRQLAAWMHMMGVPPLGPWIDVGDCFDIHLAWSRMCCIGGEEPAQKKLVASPEETTHSHSLVHAKNA